MTKIFILSSFRKMLHNCYTPRYFGQDGGYGEHVDGGTSRYDQQGVIYQAICANCVVLPQYSRQLRGLWDPSTEQDEVDVILQQ